MFILKKVFFSRTSRLISMKLDTNHAWVKGILNCSNKGPDLHKSAKNRVGSLKYFLVMNHSTIKAQIYMSAS
jgi:hypothetical protein